MLLKVTAAVLHSAQSKVLRICVPTRFGIKLYPRFQKMKPQLLTKLNEDRALTAPGLSLPYHLTVPCHIGTSNKSLYAYSLTVKGEGRQRDASNGQKEGLNGSLGQ